MNIKFKSIDINSFRSIDKAYVPLDNQGTVIVRGINEYEKKATSNGSGKSSIFEAIIYAIYEETSSGEKDVENRIIGNGYKIKLELNIDNTEYTIIRDGKSGKSNVILLKDGVDISARNKTDTNKLIQGLLGINKSLFLDSIFLSQNAVTNLASLAPANRKERLEILTNTDTNIALFKESIKQQQAEYEAKCIEHKQNISELYGKKSAITDQINNLELKINEINEEIKRKELLGDIESIEQEIKHKNFIIDGTHLKIGKDEESLQQLTQELQSIKDEWPQYELQKSAQEALKLNKLNEWNDIDKQIQSIEADIGFRNSNKYRLNKEINDIKDSDKCPTCGRKYENANEEHIKQIVDEKTKLIDEEDSNIITLNTQITQLKTQQAQIENEGKELNNVINEIELKINEIRDRQTSKEKEITNVQINKDNNYKQIQQLQSEITVLQNKKEEILKIETNNKKEYEEMIENLNKDVIEIDDNIQQEEVLYTTANDYVGAIKHSLQLITKEFRTYLLQNSLKYLNRLLEQYSQKLFSNEGDIIKIQESDTKLDIKVGNATYESMSGGEKTRVNIALLLAQKSLASMVGNISCNLIILDEILGYCDNEAESNVIDLLTTELDTLESIYMVSHKEIPIGYDSELVVVKDAAGLSRIRNY